MNLWKKKQIREEKKGEIYPGQQWQFDSESETTKNYEKEKKLRLLARPTAARLGPKRSKTILERTKFTRPTAAARKRRNGDYSADGGEI